MADVQCVVVGLPREESPVIYSSIDEDIYVVEGIERVVEKVVE